MKKVRSLKIILLALIAVLCISSVSFGAENDASAEWELICKAGKNELKEKEAEDYSASLLLKLKEKKGIIHPRKYTEYSKVILTLTAIGKDPQNVGGYDLLARLGEEKNVIKQGINGPIWALIALDSGNYPGTCRQTYLKEILKRELPEGGWNMEGKGEADPDVTAMALQALAKYQSDRKVKEATGRALAKLSSLQESDGGFSSWGTKNSESVSQVIIALCELGIPLSDKRFVKNGNSTMDSLKTFQTADGAFVHTKQIGKADALATEQANTALTEVWRVENHLASLYDIRNWKNSH